VANLTFLFRKMAKVSMKMTIFSFFEKHSPTCENSPSHPKNKILEESTLRSQEVKQTDKEIPSTRPCWIDRSEV
jgi:hypothetical protein